jgi:hypothetical protein
MAASETGTATPPGSRSNWPRQTIATRLDSEIFTSSAGAGRIDVADSRIGKKVGTTSSPSTGVETIGPEARFATA